MLINVESLPLDLRRDTQTNQPPDDCTDNRAPHDRKQNRDGDRLQLLQPQGMPNNFREAILGGRIEGRGNARSEIWIYTRSCEQTGEILVLCRQKMERFRPQPQ